MTRGPEESIINNAGKLERLRFREKASDKRVIFVSGSWQPEKSMAISPEAHKLGQLLAQAGFDLTIGTGTGIARFVIEGYRSVPERGSVIFYLPKRSEMERVGEQMEEGADDIIETELDYPLRNIVQVRESDAVVAIGGASGTVTEIIAAALDYNKPAVVLQYGEAYQALRKLTDIKRKIHFTPSVEEAIKILKEALVKKAA